MDAWIPEDTILAPAQDMRIDITELKVESISQSNCITKINRKSGDAASA